jgi:hypothetical protein
MPYPNSTSAHTYEISQFHISTDTSVGIPKQGPYLCVLESDQNKATICASPFGNDGSQKCLIKFQPIIAEK